MSARYPEREEHCTHPLQAWCDCDWCRYVRQCEREQQEYCDIMDADDAAEGGRS